LEEFARRKGGQILSDVDTALVEFEQFDLLFLLPGAEDKAERRFFVGLLLVFREPAEVEFHLAFVFGLEVPEFEVDGDEASEAAVVEEEVEVEVVGIDGNAELAGLEGEALSEFEEEDFEFAQDGVFEVLFEVAVPETEEVEDVGIAEEEVGGEFVLGAKVGEFSFGDFLVSAGMKLA